MKPRYRTREGHRQQTKVKAKIAEKKRLRKKKQRWSSMFRTSS